MTVTRDNWRTHPHSVRAFQHLDALLPTRDVVRGGAVRVLPSALIEVADLRFEDGAGGRTDWPTFLARTHTDALIALHRGQIVVEHYANGMTPASRHMLFSITKSLTGLLAELLADDGALDLDAPAASYVPELSEGAFGHARVRTLLDMRDGVAFDETYADPNADIHRYSQAYWGSDMAGVREALRRLPQRPSGRDAFAYRTPIADVVGWIVERVSGVRLADLLSGRIWRHIGAEHDAYYVLDNAGHEIAGAGLNATLRDVARLGLALMEGGLVPQPVVDGLRGGGCRDAFAAGAGGVRQGWSYRSFWWVPHDPHGSIMALGVFGQRLILSPGADMVIVRFGSHPVAANAPHDAVHAAAFAALAERVRLR